MKGNNVAVTTNLAVQNSKTKFCGGSHCFAICLIYTGSGTGGAAMIRFSVRIGIEIVIHIFSKLLFESDLL